MSVIFAVISTFGFGIAFNLKGKKLCVAALGGGIAWFFYLIFAPLGEIWQYFAAAIAISIFSEVMARVMRSAVSVFMAPALIPLVPGGLIYQAMLHALRRETELFLSTGINALIITGALSLGLVIVSSTARFITAAKTKI